MIVLNLSIEELSTGLVFTRMSFRPCEPRGTEPTDLELLKAQEVKDLLKEHLLKSSPPDSKVTLVEGSSSLSDSLLGLAKRLSLKRQQQGGD